MTSSCDHRAVFGVQRICRVVGVSRCGCYRHRATAQARAARQAEQAAAVAEIRQIHAGHHGVYAPRGSMPGSGPGAARSTASASPG